MKVAIVGGTGFVGVYLVDELLRAGHTPRLLVRPGSESKVEQPQACELVPGDLSDAAALAKCNDGADALVYLVGLLREEPARGVTFEECQYRGVERAIEAARRNGVRRCLLMSANGVREDGTSYQRTKYRAEQLVKASELGWTLFRPSVIFGAPRGRMEFCTQLYEDVVKSPFPAPLFFAGLDVAAAGEFCFSPVHVENVAAAMGQSLTNEAALGECYPLGGPEELSWKTLIQRIATAGGKGTKLAVPVPVAPVRLAAGLFDSQSWFPLSRDQLTMLMEGNTCDGRQAFSTFGIQPIACDLSALAYLGPGVSRSGAH